MFTGLFVYFQVVTLLPPLKIFNETRKLEKVVIIWELVYYIQGNNGGVKQNFNTASTPKLEICFKCKYPKGFAAGSFILSFRYNAYDVIVCCNHKLLKVFTILFKLKS